MSVLSANAAFYDAFTSADVRKMQDVWAAGDGVSCVHPGHPVIAGSAAVVNSWRALFSTGAEMPALRATRQKVVIRGNVAWVTCQETTGDEPSSLEAINVFERRDGKWLMCHHHASPVFVWGSPALVPGHTSARSLRVPRRRVAGYYGRRA